jgi:hypothetical protein
MAGPARPDDDSMGEEEPEVQEEEEEVPEDDFFEADASAELTEDEDQGEEYESDEDAVSLEAIIIPEMCCARLTVDFICRSELRRVFFPPSKLHF